MGNSETKASTEGYRIIKIAPNSPAQAAGLVEFVDFIICINELTGETTFSNDYGTFYNIIHQNENQVVTIDVYNLLTRKIRKVPMIPHKTWEKADSLLGALVRYEDYVSAHERVLRVDSVAPGSPAELMGFEPKNDYILGTSTPLSALNLNEVNPVEGEEPVEVYVYNARKQLVWSTIVQAPLTNWEREGYLGCVFAVDEENVLPLISAESNIQMGPTVDFNKSQDIEQGSLQVLAKPPTDTEVQRIRSNSMSEQVVTRPNRALSFELPKEIIERRLGKRQSLRKRSCILVDKPFTDSGLSSLSFIQSSKTMGNLDEVEELLSPRGPDSFDDELQQMTRIPLQQMDSQSTQDQLDSTRSNHLGKQNSVGSIAGDDDKSHSRWINVREKLKQEETDYSYFSKKKGGEYLIKSNDLFNMDGMLKVIHG